MWRLSKLLFVLIIPVAILGQAIFEGNGKKFAKVAQKTREPKIVVQAVGIVSGVGTLILNEKFDRQFHNVSATTDTTMCITVTGILEDTTKTVYSYSVYKSSSGDTIIIKSSGGTADTSTVDVQIILK